jgi:hypothetical protein
MSLLTYIGPICSVLEHGSAHHRQLTIDHLMEGLLEYATHEQGSKSVTKALKEGGKEIVDRVVKRMCEPAKGCILFPLRSGPLLTFADWYYFKIVGRGGR